MSKKDERNIIEIPCPRNDCDVTGVAELAVFRDDDPKAREYRLRWIRNIIQDLMRNHEAGKHVKCDCRCNEVITAVCHCRCCHCGGIS